MAKQISLLIVLLLFSITSITNPGEWQREWPVTNFTKTNVNLTNIISSGLPKDGIRAIDAPTFEPASRVSYFSEQEPVISVSIEGEVRAYPINIMLYHEIVNDTLGGTPISVTYCPLCNSSLVFDRRVNGTVLDFGYTGKIRHSDTIMYDRQTESWWQQFTGRAIVGDYTDTKLDILPSRIESFALFKERNPEGLVMVPNNLNARPYGTNPYLRYDSADRPFLLIGDYNGSLPALSRVLAIGQYAYPLSLLRSKKRFSHNGYEISWTEGQASPLDTRRLENGRDIGNVVVTRNGKDAIYHIPFAFAFDAFTKDGVVVSSI